MASECWVSQKLILHIFFKHSCQLIFFEGYGVGGIEAEAVMMGIKMNSKKF